MHVPDAVTEGLPADTIITSPFTNAHRAALVKSTLSIGSEMSLICAGGGYSDKRHNTMLPRVNLKL